MRETRVAARRVRGLIGFQALYGRPWLDGSDGPDRSCASLDKE